MKKTFRVEVREGRFKGKRFVEETSPSEASASERRLVELGAIEAATRVIRRLTRSRKAYAHRVSGSVGNTGIFQGYVAERGGGLNSIGPNVHVFGPL